MMMGIPIYLPIIVQTPEGNKGNWAEAREAACGMRLPSRGCSGKVQVGSPSSIRLQSTPPFTH